MRYYTIVTTALAELATAEDRLLPPDAVEVPHGGAEEVSLPHLKLTILIILDFPCLVCMLARSSVHGLGRF